LNTMKGKIIAVLVVLVIVAAAYGVGSGTFFASKTVSAGPILYNEDTVTTIYDNASPAVVEIDVTQGSTGSGFFGRFMQEGQGSGFVIDIEGTKYILTNNHVVSGASTINVKLSTGQNVNAKVVGTDPLDDLALISVDNSAISLINALPLGDSSLVKPGQMAIALGNPYGYDNTLTVGVISGVNRTITGSRYSGMLQTDAAINPGNSGGPLLNANGSVIGINTAIESPSTGAQGIGFAVPSNVAKNALANLKSGTQVSRPWIGISGTALTQAMAQSLGVSVNQGVYVVTVVAGSPAETAGLKGGNPIASGNAATGDVITAIDGKPVSSVQDLSSYVNTKKVGDAVNLSVLRSGANINIQVTLGARPATVTPQVIPAPNTTPQPTPAPRFPGRGWRNYQLNPNGSNNN